ncbi:hypothetical protein GCM10010358_21410 [Streptomyces minutiscleroticus]|uniref:Arginase n=1 Tax=Streptomyces minutiscleroticus TaxID=68238 RepID=A0A918KK72_9ACTN|nr:hypothetical protein [Streptomyces minutiscleroticus]GGX66635.1 hypothetical protein GCM10010358_21410 [Streptomyces minutiscleroticus]
MRNIVVIDAPSNLGLRPPAPGTVPGCYELAGALRDNGIVRRLGASEGGVVVPPRYDVDSPDPDGLMPGELTALLRPLVRSPRCAGLDTTVYDPGLDPDGTAGVLLTDLVVAAFTGR